MIKQAKEKIDLKKKKQTKKTTVHYNSTEPIIFVGDVPPKCLFN